MSIPSVTTAQLISAIKLSLTSTWKIPVLDDFPSNDFDVRFGIYVSDVSCVERTILVPAFKQSEIIYSARDQFRVLYVSFQDDPYVQAINGIIENIINYIVPSTSIELLDGYYNRTRTQEIIYDNKCEKHIWTFDLLSHR